MSIQADSKNNGGLPASTTARSVETIVERIADGLDASMDGRGWNAGHEAAKNLANAAPAMLDALERVESVCPVDPSDMTKLYTLCLSGQSVVNLRKLIKYAKGGK